MPPKKNKPAKRTRTQAAEPGTSSAPSAPGMSSSPLESLKQTVDTAFAKVDKACTCTSKKRKQRDAAAPRRPKNAYMFFVTAKRKDVQHELNAKLKANEKLKQVDVIKVLAERWKALSPGDAQEYADKAAEDKVRYQNEKNEKNEKNENAGKTQAQAETPPPKRARRSQSKKSSGATTAQPRKPRKPRKPQKPRAAKSSAAKKPSTTSRRNV